MAPISNGRLLLKSYPKTFPIPGETTIYDTSETIDLEKVPLEGGVLLKVLYLAADPYLRTRMVPGGFPLGKPIIGYGVSRVLRSDAGDQYAVGDIVYGQTPWQQHAVLTPSLLQKGGIRVIKNEGGISLSAYLSAAGSPGKTAYYGWREYSNAKAGDTVFVTSGASAVGSMVVQLAKQAGCKIIASAGSADKVDRMKSIGTDIAFNYKKEKTKDILDKEGPVKLYWDHVGGPTLDEALVHAAQGARFIEVGMISGYNDGGKSYGVKNLGQVIGRGIIMIGFGVSTLEAKYAEEFYKVVPAKIAKGKIKFFEQRTEGLERGGHVIEDVQRGRNDAKAIIVVASED